MPDQAAVDELVSRFEKFVSEDTEFVQQLADPDETRTDVLQRFAEWWLEETDLGPAAVAAWTRVADQADICNTTAIDHPVIDEDLLRTVQGLHEAGIDPEDSLQKTRHYNGALQSILKKVHTDVIPPKIAPLGAYSVRITQEIFEDAFELDGYFEARDQETFAERWPKRMDKVFRGPDVDFELTFLQSGDEAWDGTTSGVPEFPRVEVDGNPDHPVSDIYAKVAHFVLRDWSILKNPVKPSTSFTDYWDNADRHWMW